MNLAEWSEWLRASIAATGLRGQPASWLYLVSGLFLLAAGCFLVWNIARLLLRILVRKIVLRQEATWNDKLSEHRVFRGLTFILIAVVISRFIPHLLYDFPNWKPVALAASRIYIVLTVMFAVNAILNAMVSILEANGAFSDKPIRSYKQVAKIAFYVIGFVLILAIALGESPLYILGGFGAVTAVVLLIFRDPILGFVASVQMSAIDLVRVGDWITVDKYGADGEVMEINLTTVKVRNWDMTITLVPSYALVSDSFRNWRGMLLSEGRRIKRHIYINMASIRFCDDPLYEKLLRVERIRPFLETRREQVEAHNRLLHADKSVLLNGRQMTNIGIFRMYAEKYIAENPRINHRMLHMVRQLQPTEHGLPIEVYAFTYEKDWERFEEVMADIFDHLLAAVPYFELEIFQSPGSTDMRQWSQRMKSDRA